MLPPTLRLPCIANMATSQPNINFRLKRMTLKDVEGVSSLCLHAFGTENVDYGLTFRPHTKEQWGKQFSKALSAKIQATQESRSIILNTNTTTRLTKKEEREYRIQASRRLRRRSFSCFVAQEQGKSPTDSNIVGCVVISLYRPEARFPPPLPTTAPLRPYISNMAVSPHYRRQGIAKALLAHVERAVMLYCRGCNDGLWLHVDNDSFHALELYKSLGYVEVQGVKFWGHERRKMMRKMIDRPQY